MAADTSIAFYGLWHLEGETVRCSILGIDLGTAVVQANGGATWTLATDAGGLLTADYIVNNSNSLSGVENNITFNITNSSGLQTVTVPVVIGIDYVTKGQLLRPDLASDIKSPEGPGLGKTRRIHQFAMLLQNAIEIKVGTDFADTLMVQEFTSDTVSSYAEDVPFSGVHVGYVDCTYDFNGQLCWQVDGPYPCTVSSVAVWLNFAER